MRCVVLVGMALLLSASVGAETYSWVDGKGTYNFTEDYSRIPKKYRKGVVKHGDMGGQPAASRATEPEFRATSVPPKKETGSAVSGKTDNGLYAGKKAEVWQQDFRARETEYKRLEQQLVQLESLIKKPAGIPKERFDGLPQEFKATQKQYNEALKSYNDLNDAANKAGLPAEFRK